MINEYQQQAEKFLKDTGTTLKIVFLKTDKYFDDDKEKRDIYQVTMARNSRSFIFNFGNSIANSGEYTLFFAPYDKITLTEEEKQNTKSINLLIAKKLGKTFLNQSEFEKNKEFKAPNSYDILACLTKYDPGTLHDFCRSFGYDEDSRKAEKIFDAVVVEYNNLKMLYNDDELEILSEIN